jgi:hypothetical protein
MAKSPAETLPTKQKDRMEQAYAAHHRRRFSNLDMLSKLLNKDYQPPRMNTSDLKEFAEWWPFDVLRQTAAEEDIEGCKHLLRFFLSELGVRLPNGVLMPFRGKRGRPKETEAIYEAWIALGRPNPTWPVCDALARTFYVHEFAQAKSNVILRQKLRKRIWVTLFRHEALRLRNTHEFRTSY